MTDQVTQQQEPNTPTTPAGRPHRCPQRRLSLDKADPTLWPLIQWLQSRSPNEKIAALIASELLSHESEFGNPQDAQYKGSMGNDLDYDWSQDLDAFLADHPMDDLAAAHVAAVLIGMH